MNLIIGKVEVLPKASNTPNGNEIAIPKIASNQVRAKPPYIEEPGTMIKLSEDPPRINNIKIATATVHVINKFFFASFELAMEGETETNIHKKNNKILTCLNTGNVNPTTARTSAPYKKYD